MVLCGLLFVVWAIERVHEGGVNFAAVAPCVISCTLLVLSGLSRRGWCSRRSCVLQLLVVQCSCMQPCRPPWPDIAALFGTAMSLPCCAKSAVWYRSQSDKLCMASSSWQLFVRLSEGRVDLPHNGLPHKTTKPVRCVLHVPTFACVVWSVERALRHICCMCCASNGQFQLITVFSQHCE